MAAYKTILADEQVIFCEALKTLLEQFEKPKFEVARMIHTGKDLVNFLKSEKADLLIFDLDFDDVGVEEVLECLKLKKERSQTKLCVLSGYGSMNIVKLCFHNGVDGFISKSNDLQELSRGLESVLSGGIFLGDGLKVAPSMEHANNNTEQNARSEILNNRFLLRQMLTSREKEILRFIVTKMNNREISRELFISHQTVGVHRKNIMKKMGVNSTNDLIDFTEENNLLPKNDTQV